MCLQSILQSLLLTVGFTLFRTGALLGVLGCVLLFFTFIGNLHFGLLRTGQSIDFAIINFRDVFRSLNLLIRVVTGEDWHTIFRDSTVRGAGGTKGRDEIICVCMYVCMCVCAHV